MPNRTSDNNKLLAKNTSLLYFRTLFMMAVSSYTTMSYRIKIYKDE